MNGQELEVGLPSDVGGVFAALSTAFTVHAGAPETVTYTYVDSVDWRLHRAGLALREARHRRTGELVLDSVDGSRTTAPGKHGWPSRVDRLAHSSVRERIADTVGTRALLPLAEVESRRIPLRLLDDADKTRVRVMVEQQRLVRPRRSPLPLRLLVTPLRGYDRDADNCVRLLKETIGATFEPGSAAAAAFAAAGRTPAQTPTDPIALSPDDPISRSVAIALLRWLTVVEANRDGVVADLDPEFLNELRLGTSASRALLEFVGDLLPGDTATRTADGFAWLATLTSRTHNLDVCLAEFGGEGRVDVHDLTGLEPLREHLARRRRGELARLRKDLQSDRMNALMTSWRVALDAVVSADALGPPTDSVAGARLRRAYGGVLAADEFATLHRRCIRARYLLQSFASLYDADAVRRALRDLAALQARLDVIRDAEVQSAEITSAATRMRNAKPATLLTMGALRDRVDANGRRDRKAVARAVDRLGHGPTAERFAALLGDAR